MNVRRKSHASWPNGIGEKYFFSSSGVAGKRDFRAASLKPPLPWRIFFSSCAKAAGREGCIGNCGDVEVDGRGPIPKRGSPGRSVGVEGVGGMTAPYAGSLRARSVRTRENAEGTRTRQFSLVQGVRQRWMRGTFRFLRAAAPDPE